MKKILLALLVVFLIYAQCAIAESAPADGLYNIGVHSSAKMFKITDCILRVEEGHMTAILTMSGSGYGYLYQGTSAEADSAGMALCAPYYENEEGKHCFAIEIPCLDQEIPMAAWSIRYEKWYDRTLIFYSNTLKPYQEIIDDGVYVGKIVSNTCLNDMEGLIYSQNGKMRLKVQTEQSLIVDGVSAEYADGYMQAEISSLDMRIPVSIGEETGWLKLESLGLETYSVAAPEGIYTIDAQTDSALLRFTDCQLTVADGKMKALLTSRNNNFDYIYLGKATDAPGDEVRWIAAVSNDEGEYTYEIPVASLDNTLQLATYSAKKKLWYDRELTLISESMVAVGNPSETATETEIVGRETDVIAVPDTFSFSGGSGRVNIECEQLRYGENGIWAMIVFSSPNYSYLDVNGQRYYPIRQEEVTAFEIPVQLNSVMKIVGMTTAMSQAHEVAYEICIEKDKDSTDKTLAGLIYESSMKREYATQFNVDYYKGGYALIEVADSTRYLVVPENMPVPETLEADIVVLQQPLENIYLTATSAMALFDRLEALDAVRLSGTKASGWYIENAIAAMENGDMLYAGKYSEPDYELLIRENCNLAIESTMILHSPKVKEMLELLGIPVFIERASYEDHPLGRTEWIKVYGVMLDREEQAEAFFEEQIKTLNQLDNMENTGKTVAFFYITSEGSVNVRSASDYVPKMIEIAGGNYVFKDDADGKSNRSSVSLTMEEFYNIAVNADYLVYNSTIDNPVYTIEELIAKDGLLADFKAVQNGQVWCTGKYLFQATDIMGDLIMDFNHMLTGRENMNFLYKLS